MVLPVAPLRQVLVFFVASWVLTAGCQMPGVLALRSGQAPGGVQMLLMAVGSCGPTLVAIALMASSGGMAGVRALFRARGALTWPIAAVALLHMMAAHLVASLVLMSIGQYTAQHLLYPPLRPEQVAIAVLAPLGEEYGWRGYALPRLQRVMWPWLASVILGVAWALWHLPTLFVPGASLSDLGLGLPMYLAASVIYTWLFNRTGGNMRSVLLAHLGAHIDNTYRAVASGDGSRPFVSTMVVLVIAAVGLLGSRRWRDQVAVTTG